MSKRNRNIPDKWLNYTNIGKQVPHTQFLPFKVPLKEDVCRRHGQIFTPSHLLETQPNLKLIIDLTNTDNGRYYNGEDFKKHGVHIRKIKCVGGPGVIPSKLQVRKFQDIVDWFLSSNKTHSDFLIGVHCTHGLNRTGYFICKYMTEKLGIDPQNALSYFEEARGHQMERTQLIQDILKKSGDQTSSQSPFASYYEDEPGHTRPRNQTYAQSPLTSSHEDTFSYRRPANQTYSQSPLTSCYQDRSSCTGPRSRTHSQSPLTSCYEDESRYSRSRSYTYSQSPLTSCYEDGAYNRRRFHRR